VGTELVGVYYPFLLGTRMGLVMEEIKKGKRGEEEIFREVDLCPDFPKRRLLGKLAKEGTSCPRNL
jgi:hypothetical protein